MLHGLLRQASGLQGRRLKRFFPGRQAIKFEHERPVKRTFRVFCVFRSSRIPKVDTLMLWALADRSNRPVYIVLDPFPTPEAPSRLFNFPS